ncbi:uncharacterized protein LOC116957042 [Petromyzon marinus]|uniref:uncharacterized protein LOC116957042 n=1 Tax=Petromyzon marinus TaxID=7757 RepID=UPI003F6F9B51
MIFKSLQTLLTTTTTLLLLVVVAQCSRKSNHHHRHHHQHHHQQSASAASSSAGQWEAADGGRHVGPDGLWTGPECQADVPDEVLLKRLYLPHSVRELLESANDLEAASSAASAPALDCPRWSPELLKSSLLRDRSLSPWTYRMNEDPSRVPARLPEAQCLCPGCVDASRQRHDLAWASVPVTAAAGVLRRVPCALGRVALVPGWVHVAVACTCAAPATRDAGRTLRGR